LIEFVLEIYGPVHPQNGKNRDRIAYWSALAQQRS